MAQHHPFWHRTQSARFRHPRGSAQKPDQHPSERGQAPCIVGGGRFQSLNQTRSEPPSINESLHGSLTARLKIVPAPTARARMLWCFWLFGLRGCRSLGVGGLDVPPLRSSKNSTRRSI